ncbi:MAG: hypothetical protein Q4P32_09965 [Micrococcales bacterium]|nr:hypothetical protein [Micrococcales bacterium]
MSVAPLDGWTVVVPTGPVRARYPYDDAVRTLAGRPVALWMRPALGFFHVGRQAVITVHPDGWRPVQRWALWTPREGLVAPVGLPPARPADVLSAAGASRDLTAALRAAVGDGHLDAGVVLREVLDLLGLPGSDLLMGRTQIADLPGARLVEPAPRHARAFDRVVSDEARHRIETEA